MVSGGCMHSSAFYMQSSGAAKNHVPSAFSIIKKSVKTHRHVVTCSEPLCDYLFEPYPSWYQRAWHSGELWRLSVKDAQANTNGSSTPAALHQYPPILSAAIWRPLVNHFCCLFFSETFFPFMSEPGISLQFFLDSISVTRTVPYFSQIK